MPLTLVVLAAGMGSRYGGLKQIDSVGPGGATLLDFAVFDAVRAGFEKVVFVVRRDFDEVFREKFAARYAGRAAVECAFQAVETLPAGVAPVGGRVKPWGTGHALWCARDAITDSFAVINADDFYGDDSFRRLGAFLRSAASEGPGPARFAMVGFQLARTLSGNGAVSRGVCDVDPNGALRTIVEHTRIRPGDVGPGRRFAGTEIVSMNCWAFTTALLETLGDRLRAFFETLAQTGAKPAATPSPSAAGGSARPDPLTAEFYLPAAVSSMVQNGEAQVSVLPTDGTWFGVTYREDKATVQAAIADLVKSGRYPAVLFG